ncbi:MAG: PQQ-binding-like beta-propeller repeat protein [Pirellulaceae bacterium]
MNNAKSGFSPLPPALGSAAVVVFALFFSIFEISSTNAGDWPQILGPSRSGKAEGETLPSTLPSKPRIAWRAKVGSGYGGPVVVGKKVVVFHRVGNQERVEALDVANGKSLWQADYKARYRGGIDSDLGPRCVPLVQDGKVYVFGAAGDMHCVQLADGKKLWSRELYVDYDGDEGFFGAGSTPILVGGKLVVNVGGKDAGLVALDPATGKTIWKGTSEVGSYSAPTAAKIGGKEQAVFITRMNCVAFDPATDEAKVLFPFGKRGPTVNAATPLIVGGKLFVTASYNIGAELRSLDGGKASEVWGNDDTLSSQYTTAVEHEGYLYGIHGREDTREGHLRCVEAATGKVAWSKDDFGIAHAILAGDKILLVGIEGKLTLLAADSKKYSPLGSAQFLSAKTRPLPALSGGKLFVKTNEGEGSEVVCVELGSK